MDENRICYPPSPCLGINLLKVLFFIGAGSRGLVLTPIEIPRTHPGASPLMTSVGSHGDNRPETLGQFPSVLDLHNIAHNHGSQKSNLRPHFDICIVVVLKN